MTAKRSRRRDPATQDWRIVAISIFEPQLSYVDDLRDLLRKAGHPKANRSLVVREAIEHLRNTLAEAEVVDIEEFFRRNSRHRVREGRRG